MSSTQDFSPNSASGATPKLDLPAGNFKALLFDCDGTIVDSMPLHYDAWCATLGEYGCPFPEDLFYAWGGVPIVEIVERLAERHGIEMPAEEVAHRKESRFISSLPFVKPIPEVIEHIHSQHGHVKLAVVSGGGRNTVVSSLRPLGLLEKFDTLVCAEDYQRSKPDPEPYLMAAERLGVRPEDCLVFEDTEIGIKAAEAAGMQWVRVPPPSARRRQ